MTNVRVSISIITTAFCLLLAACASSPEQKVKQMEERNAALQESSGYNACMAKIAAGDTEARKCELSKLSAAGYDDKINCIEEFESAPCKVTARYNAEVQAGRDCASLSDITAFDCQKMLMDAMAQ